MKTTVVVCWVLVGAAVIGTPALAAENPFVGNWALTIPGGQAGWLGIAETDGKLEGSILWGGGSVVPVNSVSVDGDVLKVTRIHVTERKDKSGKVIDTRTKTEILSGTVSDDTLHLSQVWVLGEGKESDPNDFEGKRIPPLPAPPDLANVTYGDPIALIRGNSLDGWTLTNPKHKNGWRVEDGVLINDVPQGKLHIGYGNLRTEAEFEDFNLTLEVNVEKGGNSGVYLRGIYEVQVEDSYGKPPTMHTMGAVYSRIAPGTSAEKPAGEWQTMDITLLERHVTVKLNGTVIIDNAPLLGCTGGALWSDEFRPGPIYLQGDHTSVKYRNIVLTPIKK